MVGVEGPARFLMLEGCTADAQPSRSDQLKSHPFAAAIRPQYGFLVMLRLVHGANFFNENTLLVSDLYGIEQDQDTRDLSDGFVLGVAKLSQAGEQSQAFGKAWSNFVLEKVVEFRVGDMRLIGLE